MVDLVRNKQGKIVGWTMTPKTKKEQYIAAYVRNLEFFGIDNTEVVYKGIDLIDNNRGSIAGNIKKITWMHKSENVIVEDK